MSATRELILREASRQLLEVGYAAFTVAAVRDALGLSSGSMFHAFSSKAALAAAVYVEGMSSYHREALSAVERESADDPEQAIRALVAVHLAWIEDHRALARYLFDTLPDEVMALARAPLSERNRAFYGKLEGLVERAQAAGLVGPVDLRIVQSLCIGPAHEYGRKWTRGEATLSPRQVTPLLQDAALAALASTVHPRDRARPRGRKPEERA
jgi:AcrR family transcriptional regulator